MRDSVVDVEGSALVIRLEHRTLENGRFHVITSPDIEGLHVSANSREEAAVEVRKVVRKITELPQFAQRFPMESRITFEDV